MPSLTSELRQRRVLPLLGAYLGGMWLLTELAGFAVERFGIPGRWADGLFLAIWLLLPSALLVIWRVGPPGDAEWQRRDGTVIGLNLLLAAAVLAWLPPSASAPAPAVEAVAEPGAEPTPPAARPARVAIFTRAADAAGRQQALALLALTVADLDHDRRLQAITLLGSNTLAARLRRSGQADPLTAPLGDLRLAAQDAQAEAYVVARLVPGPEGQQLEAEFHALSPDRSLPPLALPAADPWAAADALAAEIRARFAPAALARDANDPAVRAVTTDSAESLAAYAAGLEALSIANDPAAATEALRRAWELDRDFTLAGFATAMTLGHQGRNQEAQATLQQVLPRMNRLPERQRFSIQVLASADPQRQRAVYEAWLRKYPEDREPRLALALLELAEAPGNAAALATVRELLLADGRASGYAQVAELYRRQGDDAEAARVLEEGLAQFPGDSTLLGPLAQVLVRTGRADEAMRQLALWSQLRPDLVTPLLRQALLHFNEGRGNEADAAIDQAEAQASNPGARLTVMQHRADLLLARGRTRDALAMLPPMLALQQADAQATPLVYRHHLAYLGPYAQVHGREAALDWLRAAVPDGLDPEVSGYLLAAAQVRISLALADADALARELPALRAALASFEARLVRTETLQADRHDAERLRLAGQAAEALARFRALETAWREARAAGEMPEPDGAGFYRPAIAAATAAGDLAQARRWLDAVEVAEAGDPHTRLARAGVLAASGDLAGARASLDRALATWADADPDFRPAREARALAQRLAAGG